MSRLLYMIGCVCACLAPVNSYGGTAQTSSVSACVLAWEAAGGDERQRVFLQRVEKAKTISRFEVLQTLHQYEMEGLPIHQLQVTHEDLHEAVIGYFGSWSNAVNLSRKFSSLSEKKGWRWNWDNIVSAINALEQEGFDLNSFHLRS